MFLLRRIGLNLYELVTGRRVQEALDELNQAQWLTGEELAILQQKRLYRLLAYAYQHVPYYRCLFDQHSLSPGDVLTDISDLKKLPLLTKAIIRENFDHMLTTEHKRRVHMDQLTTGGSTGHPLIFMQDTSFRDFVTADLFRHLGWTGWQLGQAHAFIWGANFELATSQTLRFKLMNWVLNRFVTNAYVLSEESMDAFTAQIRRRRPRVLFGYSSSVHRFAEFVRERRYNDIKFESIFSSAEVLYPAQRQYIEEVLGGKVFNRYGARELGGIACECTAHTALHASVENNYIEILRDLDSEEPAQAGEAGHLIVTNLNNYGMPFIRYSIEDVGAWSIGDPCPCGRELPLMELVQGRRIDIFRTKDGRIVWGGFASPLFGIEGVERFQLVQKSLDLVIARIVKNGVLDQAQLDTIERSIRFALGEDVVVRFEFTAEIPILDSGKYRYVISEIDN